MKDRIKLIMEQTGLSQQDFAAKLGVSTSSLSSIFNGRTNPTNNHVQAIHRAFPNVNISWLLFAEGEMYIKPTGSEQVSSSDDAGLTVSPLSSPMPNGEPSGVVAPQSVHADAQRMPSMFASDTFGMAGDMRLGVAATGKPSRPNYERHGGNMSHYGASDKNVNIIDKPERRIKEIRVFYDDGTYEAFVPSSK